MLRQFVHNMGISPREVVHLDSMGTKNLPTGERIGFMLHQSVDVPGCDELKHLGLIRSTYLACYIFRDTGNGSIEVYMGAFMDPGGKLRDNVAVFSACLALILIWRSMMAGQNKKLLFLVRSNMANKVLTTAKASNAKICALCLKSVSTFRLSSHCDACFSKMCTRCLDKRKLTHPQPNDQIVHVPTVICKACIAMAASMNARDIAASELDPNANRSIRYYTHAAPSSSDPRSPTILPWLSRASTASRQSVDTISSDRTTTAFPSIEYGSVLASVSMADSDILLPSPADSRFSTSSLELVLTKIKPNTKLPPVSWINGLACIIFTFQLKKPNC